MRVAVAVLAVLTLPTLARAQALWLERARPHAAMLELLRPQPAGDDGLESFSAVTFLTGRTEFSPTLHGVGEFSLAIANLEDDPFVPPGFDFDFGDGAILGSPYVGLEYGAAQSAVLLEAGVRIPIDDSKVVTTGFALGADLERQSAWYDDAITTRVGVRMRSRPTSARGLWFEGRLAPEFVYDLDRGDVTVHATYGATARITRTWVRGGIGIGGRAIFEPPDDDDTIEANHVIEGAADFLEGALRPGFSLRFPFDGNFGEVFERTLGLQLTYAF